MPKDGEALKRYEMPVQTQVSMEPFEKWGLYFVGPIGPPSNQKDHILVCTNYLKKWSKVKSMKNVKEEKVVEFIYVNIVAIFEC
jgi:hypothetical protein